MSATTPETITIPVSDSIGAVSGLLILPEHPKALMVLAHGAGAGMEHAFMEKLAWQLAGVGIGTLRYNFPFTENKKKRPDVAAVAEKTVGAALAKARELFPKLPLFAAGKSFGGRMSSRFLSGKSDTGIRGIVFYGFPLHPAGAPATDRAEHLGQVAVPILFLQGTRDALADLTLITQVCGKLPLATLVTFEGADHSFKKGKKEFIEELVPATADWLKEKL
ncbi:alpha/beta hydrolase family protein [Chryseolinea lacunae]|uniref:Dienelactone hydrolase family protein n=1 Tax=Chryseolinea lacunae TaxID=2801331 RepID=A0ABS1L1E3_9BACT|nr:alpha/beta family hydrolase [Chryseolinea lacunae]MBL0744351.1 dienelactone hydrolase family protein [Chryseolinea lacunae]